MPLRRGLATNPSPHRDGPGAAADSDSDSGSGSESVRVGLTRSLSPPRPAPEPESESTLRHHPSHDHHDCDLSHIHRDGLPAASESQPAIKTVQRFTGRRAGAIMITRAVSGRAALRLLGQAVTVRPAGPAGPPAVVRCIWNPDTWYETDLS